MRELYWFAITLGFLLLQTRAAVYQGSLRTNDQWHYLGKFCFSNEHGGQGNFHYTITTKSKDLKIMLYLGTYNYTKGSGAWDPVYDTRDSTTCQDKVDRHRGAPEYGMQIVKSGVQGTFLPSQSVRAYFWYIAVADCASNSGIEISYHLQFINPGGIWLRQFSFDEQGVVIFYIMAVSFYLILFSLHIYGVYQLVLIESWHPIIRLLTTAIGFEFASTICEMIHYLIYMMDGSGAPGLKGLGELLTMGSQLLLMFLCILIAKGWAITTSYLTERSILIVTMALFLLAYLSLFIWDNIGRDPASTLYFYDSIPGLIVIILRMGVMLWFLWCLRLTIRLESLPAKKNFYLLFGSCFTVWYLLLPAIVAFALVLDPWYRYKTVRAMTLFSDSAAFFSLVYLLWPSRAASYFNIKPTPQLLASDSMRGYGSAANLNDDL